MAVALVVAHPGHELRLYRWLEQVQPMLFVLTTGSRSGDTLSRIEASRDVARRTGLRIGPLFGAMLDRDLYRHVLDSDCEPFLRLTDTLRDAFLAERISRVVVDAWQFYNVAHDLVNLMARVACAEAAARSGRRIELLEYLVVPLALANQVAIGAEREAVELSDADLDRKLGASRAYPDVAAEFDEIIETGGLKALATETLHAPVAPWPPGPPVGQPPLYETFGEARAASGIYSAVLRLRHVQPIVNALVARLGEARV